MNREEYFKKYRLLNKDKRNKYNKKYRELNKKKFKEYYKKYNLDNRDKLLLQAKERYDNNKEKHLLKSRKTILKKVTNLTDNYIKEIICQRTILCKEDISKELVELTRKRIKTKRLLNKTKYGKN